MRLLRNRLAALGFLGAAISVPVFAQQPVNDYPAACEESKVSRGDHERAHTVFLSGKQFLEESNYDKAISYFKDAYSIDCSVHAMLPIIATAYERKGDKAEAIRTLGEYLKRAPNAPDHEVIEHRIRNLRDQLARDQPRDQPPAPAPAPTALTPPAPTASASSAVAPAPTSGASSAVPLAPAAPSAAPLESTPHEGSRSPAPWILTGVGGAAVAAGVIMLLAGGGDVSSANQDCPGTKCPSDAIRVAATKKQSDGYALENAGGVVGGVGLAAALVGVVWGVTRGPAPEAASATVRPAAGPGYGGIAVEGRF